MFNKILNKQAMVYVLIGSKNYIYFLTNGDFFEPV